MKSKRFLTGILLTGLVVIGLLAACEVLFLNMAKKDTPQSFTVTFDKNNNDPDSPEADPQTITIVHPDRTINPLPKPPTREDGLVFGGWFFGKWVDNDLLEKDDRFTTATVVTKDITVYAWWFTQGNGSAGNPFRITDLESLEKIGADDDDWDWDFELDKHYELLLNIDMEGKPFTPIGDFDDNKPFKGSFNGNGFSLKNLFITNAGNYAGLFGFIGPGGIVENLDLENVSIIGSTNDYIGAIAGINEGTIKDSNATGIITGGKDYIGGLVGRNDDKIENSSAAVTITGGKDYIGGLVGSNEGTIENSSAAGNVSGKNNVGGLVGSNNSTGAIEKSFATGTVDSTGANVGGLVGSNTGTIQVTYATGNVESTTSVLDDSNVGGLIGINTGTIENSYATGDVKSSGENAGGLVGNNRNGTIKYCYAVGDVTGYNYVGGLVGYNGSLLINGTIENSVALNLYLKTLTDNTLISIGRVMGNIVEIISVPSTFNSNYARDGMNANTETISNILFLTNFYHGYNATASNYHNSTWWTAYNIVLNAGPGFNYGSDDSWDFSTLNITSPNLPILKGIISEQKPEIKIQ